MSDASGWTAALSLEGFVALVAVDLCGEWHVLVETDRVEDFCRRCGAQAAPHDRRVSLVRDLPVADQPVVLAWRKRVWRCRQAGCPAVTWTETSDQIRPRRCLTERARRVIAREVGDALRPVSGVAAAFGVAWATVMSAVGEVGGQLLAARPVPQTRTVGVDETVFGARRPAQWCTFCTGLVDIDAGMLLDLVPGRTGKVLADWLSGQDPAWTAGIQTAVCDPLRAYHRGLRTGLPQARVVLDAFHLARLGLDELDAVRRRVQRETLGRRARKGDPLEDIARILRTAPERLGEHRRARLQAGLAAGDAQRQVATAWQLAHRLRRIHHPHPDRAGARARLLDLILAMAHSDIPELVRLAATLHEWHEQIEARADAPGATNGPTEGINLMIKKVKRVGHGFRNIANYRLRVLLYCGKIEWTKPQPTRLRAHSPRLAA